jgi:hypothetical protein
MGFENNKSNVHVGCNKDCDVKLRPTKEHLSDNLKPIGHQPNAIKRLFKRLVKRVWTNRACGGRKIQPKNLVSHSQFHLPKRV